MNKNGVAKVLKKQVASKFGKNNPNFENKRVEQSLEKMGVTKILEEKRGVILAIGLWSAVGDACH